MGHFTCDPCELLLRVVLSERQRGVASEEAAEGSRNLLLKRLEHPAQELGVLKAAGEL